MGYIHSILVEDLEGIDRIILKWILQKLNVDWNELARDSLRAVLCVGGNECFP
jgi:hypothetical protein